MKVLFLTPWFPYPENPALGTFVMDQACALRERGVEIKVVQPVPIAPFPITHFNPRYKRLAGIPKTATQKGFEVHYPRYLTLPRNLAFQRVGMWMFLGTRRTVAELHNRWPFEIIHSHTAYPAGFAANLLRDRVAPEARVCHTIHGTSIRDAPTYSKQCFRRVGEALAGADRLCFVSTEGFERAAKMYGRSLSEKTDYITNGVSPSQFVLTRSDQEAVAGLRRQYGGSLNLLFVGNIRDAKGVPELLRAFKDFRSKYAEEARLFIVGRNHMGDYIERFCAENHLKEAVILPGTVPHDQIRVWMSFADIFILPSHFEGVPTVLFEALYMKTASIFTDVGGIRGVVTEREAVLIEPGSPEGIISALRILAEDADLRRKLAEAGHRMIRDNYTWDVNAQRMIEVYKKMRATH